MPSHNPIFCGGKYKKHSVGLVKWGAKGEFSGLSELMRLFTNLKGDTDHDNMAKQQDTGRLNFAL